MSSKGHRHKTQKLPRPQQLKSTLPQYGFHIKKTEKRDTSRAYFSHSADGERSKNTSCLQNFCPLNLLPDAEDYKKDVQIKQHFKKQMC